MCFLRHVVRACYSSTYATDYATKLCHRRQLGTRLRSDEPRLPEECTEHYQLVATLHLDENDEQMNIGAIVIFRGTS